MHKFNFMKDIDDKIAADWAEAKPHAKVTPAPTVAPNWFFFELRFPGEIVRKRRLIISVIQRV